MIKGPWTWIHEKLTTGVHGVGSNYVASASAAFHLVRGFTKGWTSAKLLKGAGADVNPTEIDIGTGASDVAAGNHTHSLQNGVSGEDVGGSRSAYDSATRYRGRLFIGTSGSTMASTTPNFASGSRAFGVATFCAYGSSYIRLSLVMGGVEVALTSGYSGTYEVKVAKGFRALSGSQTVIARLIASPDSSYVYCFSNNDPVIDICGLGVGSVKL